MAVNALRTWNFETPDVNALAVPVMQGVQNMQRQEQQAIENARADEQMRMQRDRFGMEKQRYSDQREQDVKRRMGGLALLAMQDESNLPQRWQQIVSLHPNADSLPAHYRDPKLGPMALLGDAGMADDYIKFQIQRQAAGQSAAAAAREAQLHPLKMQLTQAQIAQANQRDELGQAKAGILRELMPGMMGPRPAAPSAPGPGVKPMSFEGVDADPNLIRTQTAAPPQMPQAQAQPGGIMQNLSPAQRAGVAMSIAGFGDAGKIIAESDPTKVGTKTKGEIEEKLLGSVDLLGRLNEIKAGFRPEFQTIENRMGYAWTALLDKFKAGQVAITPEQRKELEDFASFRSDAVDNLNAYIKFITGAAMTNAEASRIEAGMPKSGTGIFDGDGPSEFQSKLNSAIRRTQMAMARYNYLRSQGFSGISPEEAAVRVPLNSMPKIYDQRGAEIEKKIRSENPGINDGMLRQRTRFQLQQEFGI